MIILALFCRGEQCNSIFDFYEGAKFQATRREESEKEGSKHVPDIVLCLFALKMVVSFACGLTI